MLLVTSMIPTALGGGGRGGGLARGHSVGLLAFGGAYWPLTLSRPERVLVVSTEPPDDLSYLTTPGVSRPGDGAGGGSSSYRHRPHIATDVLVSKGWGWGWGWGGGES